MNKYNVQPLDLMQYINTKYHEPFIHELLEFEGRLDTEKLIYAINKLADIFPLLKCCYDKENNTFTTNEHCSVDDFQKHSFYNNKPYDLRRKRI